MRHLKMGLIVMVFVLGAASVAFAAPFAYVPNIGSNTLTVFDLATNAVVATIPVGLYPVGVAISPDLTRVYVVNQGGYGWPGTISVISTATNTVIATIAVGLSAIAPALTPPASSPSLTNHLTPP